MGIKIDIVAGTDIEGSTIKVEGNSSHVITEQERGAFNLENPNLYEIVKVLAGRMPTQAAVNNESFNLYNINGWMDRQVKVNLEVESYRIVEIKNEPIVLLQDKFENVNSDVPITFDSHLQIQVQNKVETGWDSSLKVGFGQKIEYGVSYLGIGGKGETSINFEGSMGVNGSESKSITVGSTVGAVIKLSKGKRAVVDLSANKGVMKIEVTYNAFLTGDGASNFNPPVNNHHYYLNDIDSILRITGMTNSIKIKEIIEIDHFISSKTVVTESDIPMVIYDSEMH